MVRLLQLCALLCIGQSDAKPRGLGPAGRDHAVEGEPADEGRGLPMAVRNRGAAPLASGRASIQAGHLGRRPAFIDEDEAPGLEVGLGVEPGLSPARYVRSTLLGGVRRLFLRVTPRRLKKP